MSVLAECPVCHQPLRWTYLLRTMWSQWRCDACGSLLAINRNRRILAIVPFVALTLVMGLFISRLALGDWLLIPAALVLAVPYFLLIDRAVVLERRGFRCQECGYDLQGQVVPRCPECGREFDELEKAAMESGVPPIRTVGSRRRFWIGWLLLAILGTVVFAGLGLTFYMNSQAIPGGTPTSRPTTQTTTPSAPPTQVQDDAAP